MYTALAVMTCTGTAVSYSNRIVRILTLTGTFHFRTALQFLLIKIEETGEGGGGRFRHPPHCFSLYGKRIIVLASITEYRTLRGCCSVYEITPNPYFCVTLPCSSFGLQQCDCGGVVGLMSQQLVRHGVLERCVSVGGICYEMHFYKAGEDRYLF
jgi:hypothetical protein